MMKQQQALQSILSSPLTNCSQRPSSGDEQICRFAVKDFGCLRKDDGYESCNMRIRFYGYYISPETGELERAQKKDLRAETASKEKFTGIKNLRKEKQMANNIKSVFYGVSKKHTFCFVTTLDNQVYLDVVSKEITPDSSVAEEVIKNGLRLDASDILDEIIEDIGLK